MLREFVTVAVDEAGGFANFRETATKTMSLINRLEALTLPKLEDVEDGLKKYLEVKERAEELDRKIEETDELIDEILYDLYGLDEDKIEVVEEAVAESLLFDSQLRPRSPTVAPTRFRPPDIDRRAADVTNLQGI